MFGQARFRVAYLERGRRAVEPELLDKPDAEMIRRSMKNQGLTSWVEDDAGNFVPVPGAMRKPKTVDEVMLPPGTKRG
jgi:hypothetical protein